MNERISTTSKVTARTDFEVRSIKQVCSDLKLAYEITPSCLSGAVDFAITIKDGRDLTTLAPVLDGVPVILVSKPLY